MDLHVTRLTDALPSRSWEPKVSYNFDDSASHLNTVFLLFVISVIFADEVWRCTRLPREYQLACIDEMYSSHDSNIIWRLRLKERERNTVLRRMCKFKLVVKSFHENPYFHFMPWKVRTIPEAYVIGEREIVSHLPGLLSSLSTSPRFSKIFSSNKFRWN